MRRVLRLFTLLIFFTAASIAVLMAFGDERTPPRSSGSRSWSTAARSKRRSRAMERGFLAPRPGPGWNYVAVPSPIVAEVKSLARGKAFHVDMENSSGPRSHFVLLAVRDARPHLTIGEFSHAERVRKAADKAKHTSAGFPDSVKRL